MSHIKFVSLILLTALLIGCGSKAPKDPHQDKPAEEIYQIGTEALEKKRYEKAMMAYESLERQYPFGDEIEKTQLNLIYVYFRRGEAPSALRAADRFIRLHPSSRYLDYAYYMRGLIKATERITFVAQYLPLDLTQRDQSDARDAFVYFDEFVTRFPNSPYAADARQRMIAIRNGLAESEYHVADYYYRKGAYLAAANRAQTIIESFPNTPGSEDALALMEKSYEKLALNTMAQESARVEKEQR